jgi:hypothetical protein
MEELPDDGNLSLEQSIAIAAVDSRSSPVICRPVTRQKIEQKMDELARESHNTHDPEIQKRFAN